MQYLWSLSPLRAVAFGLSAAFAICLVPATDAPAATVNDKKNRNKAEKAIREGEFEIAEKILRELLLKDATDHSARLGLSYALLKQRRLQDAYDHAARVITADPLSSRAHALLGQAVLASGNFRESVEEFRTSLSFNQNEALAVAGLAMVDFYENRTDLALKGLRRAVSLEPNEPDFIFNLGQAAARSEMYKEAADSYERFLAIAPKTDADRRSRIRGLIDFLRYLGKQGSLYVPSGRATTTVSFESFDSRPILNVRVNGQRDPLRFVLDTGSGMSVVSEQTAKMLNLRPIARGGLARAVGGGGKFEIVYGFLSSLEIGEVKVENVPVYIRRFFDEKNPVDGYLGLAMISKFVTAVDYGERTFTLMRQRQSTTLDALQTPSITFAQDPAQPPPSAKALEIPLRTTSSGFLSGEVQLEGLDRRLNFIIDTGASISVISEKLAALEELSSYLTPHRMRVFGAAGVAEDVKTFRLPSLAIGTFARQNINAAVLDLEPVNETAGFLQDGILGGNFLKYFRVSFDFRRGVIRLEPLSQTAMTNETVKPNEN
ncbi:MAG TPA: aspartyl protease family protein [Pyrinomonadaceae bacterium]|nr:aspartyl protease family protein [Pyrinomonadaceae bacterium]